MAYKRFRLRPGQVQEVTAEEIEALHAQAQIELSQKETALQTAITRNETLESEIAALNKDIADKANAVHGLGEQIDLLKSIIIDGLREREDYD